MSVAEFRRRVREVLETAEVRAEVAEIAAYGPERESGNPRAYGALGEHGLLAPAWPVEYGGLGLGAAEAAVVTEELVYAGVPDDAHVLSVDIVGAFLLAAGTERQKAEHLPPLARGERIATVLFTEPGCGSDLTALSTRAEREGEGWRLRGTKIYTQKSQFGDVALCAARTSTGPVAMHGITLFLLPLRSAGMHVEPLPGLANDRFSTVAIDGVLLGLESVVGAVDDGWRLMTDMLQLERTGIDFHAKARRLLDTVVARAAATGELDDAELAGRLAELDGAVRAGGTLAWEMVANLDRGTPDPVASAMTKWFVTEQFRPVLAAGADVFGLDGALSVHDEEAPALGQLDAAYRVGPAHRLASGTSEVMLSVVATAGWGLL
ncbi:acyl-CoA dehydrogenase family protein [Amycolatopsis sp. NPDC047767]|uniref:acyl-CoA dehydrogenase family protein n=1 Tax=Amycolatopsis sp. NPDC047767 TaxID=3156765 RepID=UPI0034522AEB